MARKHYSSDLTNKQWALIREYFEPPRPKGGRPRKHSSREYLDAIFYVQRNGCHWRNVPEGFPKWESVWSAYRRWLLDGTLKRAMDALARARALPLELSTALS